ncbi:hypothetical protein [Streptomyces sp. NPDC050804]|uniref:hypothetical protein n=1 Tax=Streptomyces sp. NPDC050804 TaxID=3154745 RepID=UPI00344AC9BC
MTDGVGGDGGAGGGGTTGGVLGVPVVPPFPPFPPSATEGEPPGEAPPVGDGLAEPDGPADAVA